MEIERASYIDWPGVFVGMVIASALSWLLLTFGSAIGLASISPYSFSRETGIALTLAAATWFALTQIYSIAMGAYIAARLRPRVSAVDTDEVPFRDGVTGLTVWGLAIVIGLVLTGVAAYGAARTAAPVAGAAAMRQVDAECTVDRLLRSGNPAQATTTQAPDSAATREQVNRILLNALAQGDLPQGDRDYLTQLIAARAGIPAEEAQRCLGFDAAGGCSSGHRCRRIISCRSLIWHGSLLAQRASRWRGLLRCWNAAFPLRVHSSMQARRQRACLAFVCKATILTATGFPAIEDHRLFA